MNEPMTSGLVDRISAASHGWNLQPRSIARRLSTENYGMNNLTNAKMPQENTAALRVLIEKLL